MDDESELPPDPIPEKKRRKLTPEQEDKERKYPFGHRYQVSLAKKEDRHCFVGFHDCDTLKEAQEECLDKSVEENRECVVWDYDCSWFVFRHKPEAEEPVTAPVEAKPQPKRRTGPRTVERK
jgi:hypothetical protein